MSSRCSTASQNAPPEITTAVEVYNGCEVAVGVTLPAVASTLAAGVTTTSRSMRTSGTVPVETGMSTVSGSSTGESSAIQRSADNSVATPSSSSTSSRGLSESDKIALGVGLGMGLPSIALAIVTYWSMRRRKHNTAAVE